ncbi:hypothetical protein TanjilG_11055 [Lupinus angustifolius]|uniref:CCT domain-containing protein n=1 Tax=Lupinus angustifolius TaxID=3871 RepID=A0A1J7HAP2_LUPAN|nr:PREDICTED: zinc finger protein CONSTANS-LIKE 16-like [Lupinus angustifolius]XP_019446843.1 PREDICTED: zinc finger protein CONSTANS-LIKE 16-like [Lupinus angustifolius]OIW09668.1 hypothetical protein TanjilG_11055 [Lupinus angustifolius]
MITDMKSTSALAAKTARACDSCLRRRARWFCATDDAFLCHSCDSLIHSANQLANRHERAKLPTASNKVTTTSTAQAWHSGFKRKARTPRNNKHLALQQRLQHKVVFNNTSTNVLPVVPELGGGEEHVFNDEESEEQMLCCVPVFEPFDAAEFCNIYNNEVSMKNDAAGEEACDLNSFSEFLASDMDLAEFSADVETLLGTSEVLEYKEEDEIDGRKSKDANAIIRVKDEELDEDTTCHLDSVFNMTNEAIDWNIDSVLLTALSAAAPEEEEKVVVSVVAPESKVETKRDIILRLKLNYEEVITAWDSQGSPWITGNPPRFNSDDCLQDFLGSSSGGDVQCSSYEEIRRLRGHFVDGGREARVSRYREKRRTRLFAKKIRYEVRKLNAEKRPRMKGRFVKRTCNNTFQPYH